MVESEKVLEAVVDDLLPSPAGNKSEESALYSITMVLNRTVSKNVNRHDAVRNVEKNLRLMGPVVCETHTHTIPSSLAEIMNCNSSTLYHGGFTVCRLRN